MAEKNQTKSRKKTEITDAEKDTERENDPIQKELHEEIELDDRLLVDTTALEYNLPGVQVEPEASFWARCRTLCTVTRQEIFNHIGTVYSYPSPGSPTERRELEEIRTFQEKAHDADYFDEYYSEDKLSLFLTDPKFIMPWAYGAVLNRREDPMRGIPGTPILLYGAELATLFEDETPGLWHRHVFNVFLDMPVEPGNNSLRFRQFLSPPRQALYWHALDLAIDSALQAVWHYKWLATNLPQVARRRRPYEADRRPILYDYKVDFNRNGDIRRDKNLKMNQPQPSPGTPRHPAYGSGHSTYSAAASYVLGCLIGRYIPAWKVEFTKLANNIGEARIWGGVHWRSDHTFGQQIGKVVGQRVIRQLNVSGILPEAAMHPTPPARNVLERQATAFEGRCGRNSNDFCDVGFNLENKQGLQG